MKIELSKETYNRLQGINEIATKEDNIKTLIDFYEKHHDKIENFPYIVNIRKENDKGN